MAPLRSWSLALGVAALSAGGACSTPEDATQQVEQEASELDKLDWLEKAAKILRYGRGLGPQDDVEALERLPKADVVDLWMREPRFGDAVLAFNLYYLGRSIEPLSQPNPAGGVTYDPGVFEFPQAVMAARAALRGGNFFDLFEGSPAFISTRTGSAGPPPPGFPKGERERVVALLDAAIEHTVRGDRAGGCERYLQAGLRATNEIRLLGFTPALEIRHAWLHRQGDYPLSLDCSPESTLSVAALVASMRAVRAGIDKVWRSVDDHPIGLPVPTVTSIADFPAVPVSVEGLPPLVPVLGRTFFRALPSSSTNFQRKRAAYMLKTYFCDDLTPLDIPAANGDAGTGDLHANNPNCQACHYRLDPMGALFRNVGGDGRNFVGQNRIRFDDAIVFEGKAYEQYLSQWRNPDGSFRAGYWVIGQDGNPQREPGWTDAYGDALGGLWPYMRRSKLVKSCLVRKLADYVLGPKQVYDREWLAQISRDFADGPQSGAQFRGVVKALLLSKTFSTHDPDKGVCYDLPEKASPNRSPCAIAHVVSANCAGCHSSIAGAGRLDFTKWTDIGGGTFSWSHADPGGNQLPRAESLRRMLDRITTADRNKRMPLLRAMPADDFLTFRQWLTTSLETP
jgi:hypothetical protein